ncbi:MAG: hypothetical protein V1850_06455 [Candidatus Bathyarchaeota archaeon]
MPLMIDDYRINWALRYIREAEADISAAEKIPMPAMVISLSLQAMRKSQTAVYYSLGDPQYLAPLIHQNIEDERKVNDILMRILIQIEQSIERDSSQAENLGKTAIIEDARRLLEIASEIVSIMVKKSEESPA